MLDRDFAFALELVVAGIEAMVLRAGAEQATADRTAPGSAPEKP
jgi:hypothetical protein